MKRRTPRSKGTRLGAQGRLVLPAHVREEAHLKQGDRLIVIVEDGGILLLTPIQAVRRVQAMARKFVRPGRRASEELIRERRLEAERE
jgi:AbrB family looped-hinge helix DNA binding protein